MKNGFLILLICSFAYCSGQASSIIPIALAGQPAPGTKGTFASFCCVSLNDRGALAFSAATSDKNAVSGIFVFSGGTVYPVALAGQVVPGTGGLRFLGLSSSKINNAGDLAFTAYVGDFPNRREGLFLYSRGVISSVALTDPPSTTMAPVHFRCFSLNDSGAIAFAGEDGLFLFSDGKISQIIVSDLAPGNDRLERPSINRNGAIAFAEAVSGSRVLPLVRKAIRLFLEGKISTIYPTNMGQLTSYPSLNDRGDVAFTTFEKPRHSLVVASSSGLTRLTSSEDIAPGTRGQSFSSFLSFPLVLLS